MNLTLFGVLFFLTASLLLYLLFGGADFGGGMLELFSGARRRADQQQLITRAMAPVWEANHIWLILVVVILFMAFPPVYLILSTHLFIPLMAVLVGIVGRGCAFTFRHYDTLTPQYHRIFSTIFAFSSLWTALFLGIVAGALTLGRIAPQAEGFSAFYIAPWCNAFALTVGLFTCALFAFLAAIYLVGETDDDELRHLFLRRAVIANLCVVVVGGIAFLVAEADGLPFARIFFSRPLSVGCFALATVLLLPLWRNLLRPRRTIIVRALGVILASLVVIGWFAMQYPLAIRMRGDVVAGGLTFAAAQAPLATLRALLQALLVGSLLIFPALGYLFKVFKWRTLERERNVF